ncbi:MAG TPA: thiamine-phosphate kinase [Saprospiraceae bacterium]|nr:thiamine-phosphate kinase [Saprospiraceae bacterium]
MENQEISRTEINDLGEFKLIELLTQDFDLKKSSSVLGIGDDAAVIQPPQGNMVMTTDLLVEGIHFDMTYTPLKYLGYKAVVVNLSDIYAMNAIATQITVSIAVSNRYSVEALAELYEGIREACEVYKVDLVGGDTTSSPKGLVISVTAIGFQQKEKIVTRSGAREGDQIFVSGYLGSAYLGMLLLEREKQIFLENPQIKPDLEGKDFLVERFLKPEARKDSVAWLEKIAVVPSAMMDLSDGLSSDLMHICRQSSCGAEVFEDSLPIHQDASMLAFQFQMDPITCALHGGEDYELLFVIKPEDTDKLKYLPEFYHIGKIKNQETGIQLRSKSGKLHPLQAQGWKHF